MHWVIGAEARADLPKVAVSTNVKVVARIRLEAQALPHSLRADNADRLKCCFDNAQLVLAVPRSRIMAKVIHRCFHPL